MSKLKNLANMELNPKGISIVDVGSYVGAHAGPGILSIFCVR